MSKDESLELIEIGSRYHIQSWMFKLFNYKGHPPHKHECLEQLQQ